jgi:catechol 2,3-dioxygenase-like lactoylglutathione lyase family enzyme
MKLKKAALDVVLVTRNLEAMVDFYRGILGFPVEGEVDIPQVCTIVRMACGDSLIRICRPTGEALTPAPAGDMLSAAGIRALVLSVEELEQLAAQWESAGVKFQVPCRQQRPGLMLAVIEDPDGNAIEIQCHQ